MRQITVEYHDYFKYVDDIGSIMDVKPTIAQGTYHAARTSARLLDAGEHSTVRWDRSEAHDDLSIDDLARWLDQTRPAFEAQERARRVARKPVQAQAQAQVHKPERKPAQAHKPERKPAQAQAQVRPRETVSRPLQVGDLMRLQNHFRRHG